jgi:hypothetical protein
MARLGENAISTNWYDWYEGALTCDACGWQGHGRNTAMRESFNDGAEYECPRCAAYFGYHAWPLISEVKSDPRANPLDRALIERAMKSMQANSSYVVMVDDNFHYMDEDERTRDSEHPTAEAAVARCRAIVDQWLAHAVRNAPEPMTAAELLESYHHFGEDPFVVAPAGAQRVAFSAWEYAAARVKEICRLD